MTGASALRWPLLALLLAGCTRSGTPLNEDEQVVRAVLSVLASDGRPVCVDRSTRGQPLAVFRTMLEAPRESRRPLGWRPPGPLRPPADPTARDIWRDETNRERIRLREPVNNDASNLPPLEQLRLNTNAKVLSRADTDTVTIRPDLAVAGVTSRWAPRNWFSGTCEPRYVLTNPVRGRGFGYLTVTAGHWGTTYAVDKVAGQWRTTAQWSTWLY